MFDVGGGELILIILAIIVLFGPNKIPEVAKTISKGFRQFRQVQDELSKQISSVKQEIESQTTEVKSTIENIDTKNIPSDDETSSNEIKKTEFSSQENSVISSSFKPITTELKDDDNSLI